MHITCSNTTDVCAHYCMLTCMQQPYHDLKKSCHSVDHNKQLLYQMFQLGWVILGPFFHLKWERERERERERESSEWAREWMNKWDRVCLHLQAVLVLNKHLSTVSSCGCKTLTSLVDSEQPTPVPGIPSLLSLLPLINTGQRNNVRLQPQRSFGLK